MKTETDWNRMAELYRSGYSIAQLIPLVGCKSPKVVTKGLRKLGVQIRPKGSVPGRPKMSLRKMDRDELRKEALLGTSLKRLSQKFGVCCGTISEALSYMGLSSKMLKREPYRTGTEHHSWRGGSRADTYAQGLVVEAIKDGLLVPKPCEVCGSFEFNKANRRKVHAHHDDYNFPLKVRWLCHRHHLKWHRENFAIQTRRAKPSKV